MSGFPFRGRGLALPSRWPLRPPFGFGSATLVGLAPSWGFGSSGTPLSASASLFILRFRPFSSPARSGSHGHRNDTFFVPMWILRFFPSYRAAPNGLFDRVPLQGCVPFRECPPCGVADVPATASLRVPSPSTVPVRAALPRLPRLGPGAQGFPTLLTPSSPPRTSPECFIRVRPWGFPLQGFFLASDCVRLSTPAGPRAVSRTRSRALRTPRLQGVSPEEAVTRRGLLRRRRAAALLGFSPLQGFQPTDLSAFSGGLPRRLFDRGLTPDRGLSGKLNRPAFPGLDDGGRSRPS